MDDELATDHRDPLIPLLVMDFDMPVVELASAHLGQLPRRISQTELWPESLRKGHRGVGAALSERSPFQRLVGRKDRPLFRDQETDLPGLRVDVAFNPPCALGMDSRAEGEGCDCQGQNKDNGINGLREFLSGLHDCL